MTTLLFIHSAGSQGPGEGSSALLAGLRAALPDGMTLDAPLMPEPHAPAAEPWIAQCQAAMAGIADDFVVVGHSLGGSILLQTLCRFGMPRNLAGVVLLAAPFWSAKDWNVAEFALDDDAPERLDGLARLVVLQGDQDDVVAADHPQRYATLLPQARVRMLPGVDHEAAKAAPHVMEEVTRLAGSI